MKLSNKILIGFFGFIFIYMISAFTELRFSGNLYKLDDTNRIVESVDIVELHYLIVPEFNHWITIKGAAQPRIEVHSITGDVLQNLKYEVMGDTLVVRQFELEEMQRANLIIYVAENSLRGMKLENSQVSIETLSQDTLTISQAGGWLRVQKNTTVENISLMLSEGADFNYAGPKLNTLSLSINKSRVSIEASVRRIEGTMKNGSFLYANGVDEIDFKKDESCNLILN